MTTITIIPATAEHARLIAPKIVDTRLCAIWRKMGRSPEEAAAYSIERSIMSFAGFANGEIGAIFGLGATSFLSDKAMPWLIPTELVAKHSMGFLRRSRQAIKEMTALYPTLEGFVEDQHAASILWLKWLGFIIHEPNVIEPLGASFRRFEMVTHG